MTDLTASNDARMTFQAYIEEKTQKFLAPNFHLLIFLSFINIAYTVNHSTFAFLMIPRELQSISRLTMQATNDEILFCQVS